MESRGAAPQGQSGWPSGFRSSPRPVGTGGSHRLGPHQSQWNWRPCPRLLSPVCVLLPTGLRGFSRASRVSAFLARVGPEGFSPDPAHMLIGTLWPQGTEARVNGGRAGSGLDERVLAGL